MEAMQVAAKKMWILSVNFTPKKDKIIKGILNFAVLWNNSH
jgi:hypothetical protein